jgi:hypothetical protein
MVSVVEGTAGKVNDAVVQIKDRGEIKWLLIVLVGGRLLGKVRRK